MTTLLHISASPRGAKSESLAIAETFLSAYRDTHPEVDIQTWDLWDGTLPEFGPAAAHAKMAVFAGADPMGEEAAAWRAAQAMPSAGSPPPTPTCSACRCGTPGFRTSSSSSSTWSASPGWSSASTRELGYTGLLTGRKAAVVYTSAVYGVGRPPSFGSDFQAPYLRDWLNWAGINDITEVAFRPNLATADADLGGRPRMPPPGMPAKVF